MIEQRDVEQQLALNHETRSFEVKGPRDFTDKSYVAKIARAVMAMGNLSDGGVVCLGIDDKRMHEMMPGLTPTQATEWSNFDNVSGALAKYSDPPVSFQIRRYELSNGVTVVVLDVAELDRVPHVCKKEFPDVLQNGFTYVRPRGKPESVTVPSSSDMRDLLDIAINKGVREFIRRAGAAGLPLSANALQQDPDKAAYDLERSQAWPLPTNHNGSTTDTQAGFFGAFAYTDVAVRPGIYNSERLSPDVLEPTLIDHVVRLRGWPVPMVDLRDPLNRHGTWIGQDISAQIVDHEEAWRLFTSAQFLHRRVLTTDLNSDRPELTATHADATGAVAVWDVLLYMVEIAEFAARWVTTLECDTVTFEIALNNVAGRQLISGDRKREVPSNLIIKSAQVLASHTIATAQLLANTRGTGVDLAQQILRQFGAAISDQVLLDYQAEILS
ncbi:ATP-binding protein [Rhodococcus erythropolis]|uniref:AlbA family DNA-binding domain-containing protein n=1 Tax=Rhodococcus erythropolis TaxID=1833 RepID=UPI001E55E014|nr:MULTISPECIES: ATP-binding protein [Rhodococcus erythropolis group]MCD2107003.1 ATP-binding protein [Rhodococcus qingshengii]MCZ4525827.1 ATP-binding protein [Rhodococcus erythropolis]